jgi:hypothetical protein
MARNRAGIKSDLWKTVLTIMWIRLPILRKGKQFKFSNNRLINLHKPKWNAGLARC